MPGGRPKKYATPEDAAQAHADRERTRRERTLAVDRQAIEDLMRAIDNAAERGDEEARLVKSADPHSLLRNLALLFHQRAGGS